MLGLGCRLRSANVVTAARPTRLRLCRALTSTPRRHDVLSQLEQVITPRELVEKKRKEFEAKYGDKLRQRAEAEGVSDLDALKEKVLAPSIKAQQAARKAKEAAAEQARLEREAAEQGAHADASKRRAQARLGAKDKQAEGDRSGVRPLASILNLPLLHLTPHTSQQIADIWTAYHTTHATLAPSFLCAHLPPATYESMLDVARENPFFVLPLPRGASGSDSSSFEMFYLQWLFHPAPSAPPPATAGDHASVAAAAPLPPTTSVIFTPLEEFKRNREWAQPHLVLTHYPDLARTHGLVLMRGEITPASATGPAGSPDHPGFVLSQQEAQLLSLALQRFYCGAQVVPGETDAAKADRGKRLDALRGFRERPQEWDWEGLVGMAYGGLA